MKVIGLDTETHLIGVPDIIPRLVCVSWDIGGEDPFDTPEFSEVVSNGSAILGQHLRDMWEDVVAGHARVVLHNAPFDLAVLLRYCQDVYTGQQPGAKEDAEQTYLNIWEALEKSMDAEWEKGMIKPSPILVSDTLLREKLYNLSTLGGVDQIRTGRPRYSLADLVKKYFRMDITEGKVKLENGRVLDAQGRDITGTPQAGAVWRLRYSELDGIPTERWPAEARSYAIQDALWARRVWAKQEKARTKVGRGSMNSESLQVYAGTVLQLASAQGWRVDAAQRDRVQEAIKHHLSKLEPVLRDAGIIRSNGTVNQKLVQGIVKETWKDLDQLPVMTEKGHIATGKEVMEVIVQYDPRLEAFATRQLLAKLRDAFMPALQEERVYTSFDILKNTGRCSSRSAKGMSYPSMNSQQIPRREGVREIFLPDAGYLITSIDYGALELCSVAQNTYSLFGHSVHREKINAGYDLHSYLGAGLATKKEPALVNGLTQKVDRDRAYQAFLANRLRRVREDDTSPEAEQVRELAKRAKHFRSLAKPVGLGYPGGLSVRTLCVFAKTVYGVEITPSESEEFRELWFETYPEMTEYFRWVQKQTDGTVKEDDGSPTYAYETLGFQRFRCGATYCATANGASMQSLAADGAKRALCWVGRACAGGLSEDNPYRILDACKVITFIHDENLIAIPEDPLTTWRAAAVQQLMIPAMQMHMPDVRISAEPALMRRWVKAAEAEWEVRPGQAAAAMREAIAIYGDHQAQQMFSYFSIPGEPDKCLVPWDDKHTYQHGLGGFENDDK